MQGWEGGQPSLTRINPIYSETEDAAAGRSKASSSGYGSQRGSGGGSLTGRVPPPPPPPPPDLRHVPTPVWPPEDHLYSAYNLQGAPNSYRNRHHIYRTPSDGYSTRSEAGRRYKQRESVSDRRRRYSIASRSESERRDSYTGKDSLYVAPSEGYSSRSESARKSSENIQNFLARHQSYVRKNREKRVSLSNLETGYVESELNFITKEFDYLTKLNADHNDKYLVKPNVRRENRAKENRRQGESYAERESRRPKERRKAPHARSQSTGDDRLFKKPEKVSSPVAVLDPNKLISDVEITGDEIAADDREKEEVATDANSKKGSINFYDSLQADPFLLYSHFIAQEEVRTNSSSVRGQDRRSLVSFEPKGQKGDSGYEYITKAQIETTGDKTAKTDVANNDGSGNAYSTIAEISDNAKVLLGSLVNENSEKVATAKSEDGMQSASMSGEREDYLRALLEDVALALEQAAACRRPGAQGGLLGEARERVALGLVALRRAGPRELRELSACLARSPAKATHAARPPRPPRPASPHARKPSLWQHYYMRAHSIHSLDSAASCIEPQLRPEAQFTLGAAGERRLAARLAEARRARRACRLAAAAAALLFFLLALVACSLLLTNGRASFGSMM